MFFSTTALLTILAAIPTVTAQNPDAVDGYFKINNFYAHHVPGSVSSYIAFEASVEGPAVKPVPVTYCSFYGGNTTASQLATATSGSCLDPRIYWTFAYAAPPGETNGNYTFAIYHHETMNSTVDSYDLAIVGFPPKDIKTYHSVPRKPADRYAYVATPTQFSAQATRVNSPATHPPPPK